MGTGMVIDVGVGVGICVHVGVDMGMGMGMLTCIHGYECGYWSRYWCSGGFYVQLNAPFNVWGN